MTRAITGKEDYIGTDYDIAKICHFLTAERTASLTDELVNIQLRKVRGNNELTPIPTMLLSDFLNDKAEQDFNFDLFDDAVANAGKYLQKMLPSFRFLGTNAYVIARASGLESIGGFHGEYGIGYQYFPNFAFSELLNNRLVNNPDIRALELVRNYIHDSLHAATFRSFKLADEKPYRFQYGINFRTHDGYSYSAGKVDEKHNFFINLNMLMDGVVTSLTVDSMSAYTSQAYPNNYWSHQILQDLRGDYTYISAPNIQQFANDVMNQVDRFLTYWGGSGLKPIIGRAMLEGDLSLIEQYFTYGAEHRATDGLLASYLHERRDQHPFLGNNLWQDLFISRDYHAREMV